MINPELPSVLIVGTSMSERPAAEIPAYPELLSERLQGRWRVETAVRGGVAIDTLFGPAVTALQRLHPAAFVLHIGVNDCAPRPLTVRERALLGRLRPHRVQEKIIDFIHRHRPRIIRWRGAKQFTALPVFLRRAEALVDTARACGAMTIILPITRVPAAAEVRQPFFNREIDRYNDGLRSLGHRLGVRFVEREEFLSGLTPEEAASEPTSVHLNGVVHERLTRFLADLLLGFPVVVTPPYVRA